VKTSTCPQNDDRLATGLSGRNLISELKRVGVSKYRLAKELGISYRSVQYWAKGKIPSTPMAEKLAAYLGLQSPAKDNHADILRRLTAIEAKLGMEEGRP
jgi:transcriptional regulator with XRE-family HTH domain